MDGQMMAGAATYRGASGHIFNDIPSQYLMGLSSFGGYYGLCLDFTEGISIPATEAGSAHFANWLVTDSSSGDTGVIAVADSSQYGILKLSTGGGDNDNIQLQLRGSMFRYSATKRLWFMARVALTDADDSDFAMGLVIESATAAAATAPTDGIYFRKAETATDYTLAVRKNDTETTAVTGLTLADSVYHTIGFSIDNAGAIKWYVDSFTTGTAIAATNAPDDEDLTLALDIQTGAGDVADLLCDWLICVAER